MASLWVLGLAGGLAHVGQTDRFGLGRALFHDSAAVLLRDGQLVAAIEEERLNRIKHTNKLPLGAVRACLELAGVGPHDLDCVAYYADDAALSQALGARGLTRSDGAGGFADALRSSLRAGLGGRVDHLAFRFVRHHRAHAMSAYLPSGFDQALVFTVDGMGEDESSCVWEGRDGDLMLRRSVPIAESLGFMYADLIRVIGFGFHDEYKAMGLAPHGDPARFRDLFASLYTLGAEGSYRLHREQFPQLYRLVPRRRPDDDPVQDHKDFAAALQSMLEDIVFHVLGHFRAATGLADLCLAGGVAQNCSLNGMLLRSGLFDRIFVQPASTDAGAALGAALAVHRELVPSAPPPCRLDHVYLGREAGSDEEVVKTLERWRPWIRFERLADACVGAARLLADGKVLGWVQGRSEFGPRALGNRSIVADPRPAANRDRINALVKKREAFRPFAPAVLEECVHDHFELPAGTQRSPFMTLALPVRPDQRERLAAVTHVDGTARVQTVSRETNERFWRLIDEFRALSGVPVLLNTSFNNNCEPMVDSVDDAVVSLLTTGLDALVVGDWLVTPARQPGSELDLFGCLPPHMALARTTAGSSELPAFVITSNVDPVQRVPVSRVLAGMLLAREKRLSLRRLAEAQGCADPASLGALADEVFGLWTRRLLVLRPALA